MTSPKSPISPEERARAVVTLLDVERLEHLVAMAIRGAENDALERAAAEAERMQLGRSCFSHQYGQVNYNEGCQAAATAIRSLKHKDTP